MYPERTVNIPMFSIGELVLYGAEGVCRIINIEELDLTGEVLTYYTLSPESDHSSTIFVPTENSILTERLKALMTEEEIRAVVADRSEAPSIWTGNTNQRKNRYHEIINSGDRKLLIALVRELYARHRSVRGSGQRFPATDEHYYKLAQKILFDEFSRVIPLSKEEFLPFIIGDR